MNDTTPLLYEKQGAIARLTFNRPAALNALDVPTAQALLAASRQIAADPEIRVLLVRGNGRAFMAGGDLPSMRANPAAVVSDLINPMHEAQNLLAGIDAPIVAAVQGSVAGAGISVMLAADIVLAADNTKFNLAYANVGASGDLGVTWTLPRAVGMRKALELMLLCKTFDAQQALELTLVNQVLPAEELDAAAENLAAQLAAGPTKAYGHIRRLMRQSLQQSFSAQLDAEAQAFGACTETRDFVEAVGAFLEKRRPDFEGK